MWSLEKLFEEITLPEDAVKMVRADLAKWSAHPLYRKLYECLRTSGRSFWNLEKEVKAAAPTLETNAEELALVLLCDATQMMYARFLEKGYSEELFWHSCRDIRYKMMECKQVRGHYGIFVLSWYSLFYLAERLELGRLQFEQIAFPQESYTDGKVTLKKGDPIVNIHIPSAGPLTAAAVEDALAQATRYFDLRYDGAMYCYCHSWLLFPPYQEVFGANSNTAQFAKRFDVFHVEESKEFDDAWRLFSCDYHGDPDALPQDTRMQKAMVAYLKTHTAYGCGCGILRYDGKTN